MIPLAAIPAVAQGVYGLAQLFKGASMNAKRPEYQIPDEVKQNLTQAQMQSFEGLPAEQKKQYLENLQRGQAFQAKQLNDRSSGVAGIASMAQSQNDALKNLLGMDAQARMQNQANLMQQRSNMAQYQDKAFQINQMEPYMQQAQAAESLKGAGLQNIFGGLTSGVQTALEKDMYQKLLGDQSQPANGTYDQNALNQVMNQPQDQSQGGTYDQGMLDYKMNRYSGTQSPEIQNLVAQLNDPFLDQNQVALIKMKLAQLGYRQ